MTKRKWTKTDTRTMKAMAGKKQARVIARKLRRTEGAVFQKATRWPVVAHPVEARHHHRPPITNPRHRKVGDSLLAAAAMRAISVMPIGAVGGPVPHRGAACRTPLCPLGHHAPRRLRHVRNEIGTKPHRIGRAGLTGLGCTLSGSASRPHCANSNQ
jgi:hypothetical protein